MQLDYSQRGKLSECVRLGQPGGGGTIGNHYTSSLGQESLLQTTTKFNSALPSRQGKKKKSKGNEMK